MGAEGKNNQLSASCQNGCKNSTSGDDRILYFVLQQVNYIAPTDGKLRQLDSIAERQETWYIVLQMDYPYFILISFFIPTQYTFVLYLPFCTNLIKWARNESRREKYEVKK